MTFHIDPNLSSCINHFQKWQLLSANFYSGVYKFLYRRLRKEDMIVYIDRSSGSWFFYCGSNKSLIFDTPLVQHSDLFQNLNIIEIELNNLLTHAE